MTQDESKFLISGALGTLFVTLIRMKSALGYAKVGNVPMDWKSYLRIDWISIALSFVSVLIWYYTFKEVAATYSKLQDFARLSFVTMGAMGSWVIQLALGEAKKKIKKVIDIKTDIADDTKNEDK